MTDPAADARPEDGHVYMDPVWRLVETYHGVVYYAAERQDEYPRLGLRGGWMGYFASRAGALGTAGPDAVAAAFYNFHPAMVAGALPDAWKYTSPELALAARLRVFDRALRRLLGPDVDTAGIRRAAELARRAVGACDASGRVLFAAHRALPVPEPPHLALFWATTALREFRGDGHNAALLHEEVDGCEANVLMTALGLVPPDQRTYRGWTEDDWASAQESLRARGWLAVDGNGLMTKGRDARARIEQATERLAASATDELGPAGVEELSALLSPVVDRIVSSGEIPYPNGVGVPPVQELAPGH